jgi:MATE family multidrug resistance protein
VRRPLPLLTHHHQANTARSAYYIIGIPIGAFLAFRHGLGLAGLWAGLTLALVYCAALGVWVCTARTDWDKELAKVERRLARDSKPAPGPGAEEGAAQ